MDAQPDPITDVRATRDSVVVDAFETPVAFVDFFRSNYGPTVAAYRGLADDSVRAAELDEELAVSLAARIEGRPERS